MLVSVPYSYHKFLWIETIESCFCIALGQLNSINIATLQGPDFWLSEPNDPKHHDIEDYMLD